MVEQTQDYEARKQTQVIRNNRELVVHQTPNPFSQLLFLDSVVLVLDSQKHVYYLQVVLLLHVVFRKRCLVLPVIAVNGRSQHQNQEKRPDKHEQSEVDVGQNLIIS